MSVLYVADQGATITKTDGRIVIRRDSKILEDLPARNIESVIIFGNAHLTTPAMKFFLTQGIDVSLLSIHGKYTGRLQGELCKNAELRRMQYRHASNKKMTLKISKAIVYGKLHNMARFLKRQRKQDDQTRQAVQNIETAIKNLAQAGNLDSVRGYEGSSASMYYRALSSLLRKEFRFNKRTHYPPRDKTNILLSLGYTLLHNLVYSFINVTGLDPYQGFCHQSRQGHATLASDLMEEFRSIIVDSTALTVVNNVEISGKEFTKQDGMITLSKGGLEKYLARYEERLRTVIRHPLQNMRLNYRQCIEAQVRHFARVITGKEKDYVPFMIP